MDQSKQQNKKKRFEKPSVSECFLLALILIVIGALALFCIFCLDHLMHSDMSAEVVLSKLLSDENSILSKNWYYSTEIRVVYSHLIMAPLFKICSSYRVVKTISIFIFYALLILSYCLLMKRTQVERKWMLLSLALLFTPLSNEYLDMMLIGCFYTTQAICTYLVLSLFLKKRNKDSQWVVYSGILFLTGVILGMIGLRFLASLYLPMFLAVGFVVFTEPIGDLRKSEYREWDSEKKNPVTMFTYALMSVVALFGAGIGFLINKLYLAKNYSFDTTSEVVFVPLADVPDRFLVSIKLMLEFFGYYEAKVVSKTGIMNAVKILFFLFFVGVIIYLYKNRNLLLNLTQKILLYFFLFCFFINWFMLIFSGVLQQYRYWIPVYITGIALIAVFFQVVRLETKIQKPVMIFLVVLTILGSLYSELWRDVKYNDCEKRYAYLDFLEEQEYTFGYATFWNASVTEYLANGTIKVGNLGGKDGVAAPYEWLTPKDYYRQGYHTGKTFLLLAKTEEAGMLNGDFTVMPDGVKVYEDENYVIYEGYDMYLFSEDR